MAIPGDTKSVFAMQTLWNMVLTMSDNKLNKEKFKDNNMVDQQDNEPNNSSINHRDYVNILPPNTGVSDPNERGHDEYWQGDLDQSNKNSTYSKLTCDNKDLKEAKYYL